MIVERKIKVVTRQYDINKPLFYDLPMKEWNVEIYILDQDGKEKPARCFTKAVYHIHPSFAIPVQTFMEPPFKCTNESWGDFEMFIDLYAVGTREATLVHGLRFDAPSYEHIHNVVFKDPSHELQAILRETGPVC